MDVLKIKNALFSTAYLPPVEYFVYLLLSENIRIEAYETYPKQTYRNRCYIYSGDGVESLHIPIIKPRGNHSKTGEVLLCNSQPWQRNHWRAISAAYSNAPFFIYYSDLLKTFYHLRIDNLLEFNTNLLNELMSEIGIVKTAGYTDCFVKRVADGIDFRTTISPKYKNSSVLSEISFPYYEQVFEHKHGFVKNLSILDLLFNKGPDTKEYLLECAANAEPNSKKDKQP